MGRTALYQLFRHIPDVDDAAIDAAVSEIVSTEQIATRMEQVATRADLVGLEGRVRLLQWTANFVLVLLVGGGYFVFRLLLKLT